MAVIDSVFNELIKNGYSEENGKRSWNIAEQKFLYLTPEQAHGFLKFSDGLERYKATTITTERILIEENCQEFLESLDAKAINVIDMGCGDGSKALTFLKQLPKGMKARYYAVDVNEMFADKAAKLVSSSGNTQISHSEAVVEDLENVSQLAARIRSGEYKKNVILLFGSTLASFEINDLLFAISRDMLPGDVLIIGNGIRTGERMTNLNLYKNSLFNDWFIHLMKGLGFKENEVEYDARFAHSRVEGFYKILVDKTISNGEKKIEFKKDDEVMIVYQYKYYADELEEFCRMYFGNVFLISDSAQEHALVFCTK